MLDNELDEFKDLWEDGEANAVPKPIIPPGRLNSGAAVVIEDTLSLEEELVVERMV
jgi:hypothetical protein